MLTWERIVDCPEDRGLALVERPYEASCESRRAGRKILRAASESLLLRRRSDGPSFSGHSRGWKRLIELGWWKKLFFRSFYGRSHDAKGRERRSDRSPGPPVVAANPEVIFCIVFAVRKV